MGALGRDLGCGCYGDDCVVVVAAAAAVASVLVNVSRILVGCIGEHVLARLNFEIPLDS